MIIEEDAHIVNSLAINAKCKIQLTLESESDLEELKYYFSEHNNKYYIVGEGTNLVLPEYFDGIIIKTKFKNIIEDNAKKLLKVGAGYNWNELVKYCLSKSIYGFENLVDIPGSVGAAPIQNIGAYGSEVSSLIESIDCYCLKNFRKVNLKNSECNFIYRNSSLKNSDYLIYNINFITNKEKIISTNYETITKFIKKNSIIINNPIDLSNVISKIRSQALPDPKLINNVGSFFKNPIVEFNSINFNIHSKEKLILWNHDNSRVKVGAARLIELIKGDLSLHKNVSLYNKHCLVLVTNGKASQEDILNFASEIQELVLTTFNINLEIEPNIIY